MTSYPPGGGYPPPTTGYGPGQQPKRRLHWVWYLTALVILGAAVAWLIASIVSLVGTYNGLQRVPLPAGGTVRLGHSGSYVVYYEGPGAQSGNIPSFNIRVRPASPGASVSGLTQYRSSVTYSTGSHHGRAVLTLNIARPGKFAVTASSAAPGAGADLAIGGNIAQRIVGVILPAAVVAILVIAGGVTAILILAIRGLSRRRAQRMYG